MLWHLILGHPSFKFSKSLFPKHFVKQDILTFQCEVYEFSKYHKKSLPKQTYKTLKPFSMIHRDGLSPLWIIILDFIGYIY